MATTNPTSEPAVIRLAPYSDDCLPVTMDGERVGHDDEGPATITLTSPVGCVVSLRCEWGDSGWEFTATVPAGTHVVIDRDDENPGWA